MEFVLGEATVSIRVRSMRMHGFLMRVFQSKRFYLVFFLTVSLFFFVHFECDILLLDWECRLHWIS